MLGPVALIMQTLFIGPQTVQRISISSSLHMQSFTQTSNLPPERGCERGFFLNPSTFSGYWHNAPGRQETGSTTQQPERSGGSRAASDLGQMAPMRPPLTSPRQSPALGQTDLAHRRPYHQPRGYHQASVAGEFPAALLITAQL